MSIIERIKEMILGVEVMSVTDAEKAFADALTRIDKDEDGMVSVRELIAVFREVTHE